MKFRVAITVLEKLGSSLRTIRVINLDVEMSHPLVSKDKNTLKQICMN